jgi:hypothetical protein
MSKYFPLSSLTAVVLLAASAAPAAAQVKEGTYHIVNVESGRYLDADTGTIKKDGTAVQQYGTADEKKKNRQWKIEKLGDDKFYISCVQGGRFLDADKGGLKADQTLVQLWAGKGKADQTNRQWRIEDAGDGAFFIICVANDRLLDVHKSVIDQNGAPVQLRGNKANDSPKTSKWKLVEVK